MSDDVAVKPPAPAPEYLGDGLYVEHDGWHVRLYAPNNLGHEQELFLEPDVLAAFLRWVERLKGRAL